jgi:hypothetical protein
MALINLFIFSFLTVMVTKLQTLRYSNSSNVREKLTIWKIEEGKMWLSTTIPACRSGWVIHLNVLIA